MDIEAELSRIIINEASDQQVIVLKERYGDRSFPIVIGIVEIFAIDRRLKGIKTPRPMTHDLIDSVIKNFGGKLDSILITDLEDQIFYAKVRISSDGRIIDIDSRPSDAVALAAATNCPIFVAEKVFDKSCQ